MDTEVTKQLSTIITLKKATEEQIQTANKNFKKNVFQNYHKIDVFQDLQSFLDIAMENQDVYDRDKIDAIKCQMNVVLDRAAQEMDMFVIQGDHGRQTKLAQNVVIPENRKQELISVMRKLANRGKEHQDRSTKLFQKWRLKRLAKKMLLASKGIMDQQIHEIPEVPEHSDTSFDDLEEIREAYEQVKRQLVIEKKNVLRLSRLEIEIDSMKSGIQKIAKTLEIPLILNMKEESNDEFLKTLNMINFEIEYLKRPHDDQNELGGALNEIEQLKAELLTANQIIQELSEASYQKELEPQSLQESKLLVSKIDTTIVDMEKSNLMNKIEELEEEHQHSMVETGRYMQEIEDLQERVKKYENQLVYYKNTNDLQNKEVEHLKNTKRLYEECMDELNKAELEISDMKRQMIELNEIKRKYMKAERKLKKIKMSEDWQGTPDGSTLGGEDGLDISQELDQALNRIMDLERELKEEKNKTLTIKDDNELEALYENSQREIEHLNQELQRTWKKLNQMDHSELLERLEKAHGTIDRMDKRLTHQADTIDVQEGKIRSLEAEIERYQEMANKPSINSQDMLEIINKIEDSKQSQRFSHSSNDAPSTTEYINEIKNLKSRLSKAEKEKKNLRIDIKTQAFKENEVRQYKDKIERLEKELEKFKKSKEGSIDKKKHESVLRRTEAKNEKLHKKIKELEKEILKLRESEKDLSDELERIIKERELFIQAARTKRDSTKTTSSGNQGKKKLIAIHSDKNEVDMNAKPIGRIQLEELDLDLEQENQALRDELDFMTRLKDKFSKKLNEKRKEVIYVKEERDQAIKIKEEIEDELEKAYEDIDRLEEEKTEHIRIIEELRSRLRNIKDYEIEINNLQIRLKVFSDENDELFQKNEGCLKQIDILKIKIEELMRMNSDIIDGNNTELTHVIDELRILKVKFAEVEVSLSEEIRLHKETKIELHHSVKRCEDMSEKMFHSMNEIELLKQKLSASNNQNQQNQQVHESKITIESKTIEEYKVKITHYIQVQNQLKGDLKEKIEEIMKRDELLSKRDEDMARHLAKIQQLGNDLKKAHQRIKELEKKIKELKRDKRKQKPSIGTTSSRRRINKNQTNQQSQSFSVERVEWKQFNAVKVMNRPVKTIVADTPAPRPSSFLKSIDRRRNVAQVNMSHQGLPVYKINLGNECCKACGRVRNRNISPAPMQRIQTANELTFHRGVRTMEPSVDLNRTNNSNQQQPIRINQINKAINRAFQKTEEPDQKGLKIRDLKNIPIDPNFFQTNGGSNMEDKDIRRSSSVPFNPMATHNSAIFESMHGEVSIPTGYKTQPGFFKNKRNDPLRGSKNHTTAHTSNRVTNDILRASSNSMVRFRRRVPSIADDVTVTGPDGNLRVIQGYKNGLATPVNRRLSKGSNNGSASLPRRSHSASKHLTINSNRTPNHPPSRTIRTTKNEKPVNIETEVIQKKSFSSFFVGPNGTQSSKMVTDKKITIKSKLGMAGKPIEPDMVKVIESEGEEHLEIGFEAQKIRPVVLKVRKDQPKKIQKKPVSGKERLKAHRRSINPDSFVNNKSQIKNKVEEKYQKFKKSSTTRNNMSITRDKDANSRSKKLFSFGGKQRKMPNSSKKVSKRKGITGKYSFGDGKGMNSFEATADRGSNGSKRSMAKKISMLTGNGGIGKMKAGGKFSYFN